MSSQSLNRQSQLSEELTTETVDVQNDRRDAAWQAESSQSRSTSAPRPSSSPATPPRFVARRRRLTTTFRQGDFARGQRTLPAPVAPVGTFATR
jgi:hypothetical protein